MPPRRQAGPTINDLGLTLRIQYYTKLHEGVLTKLKRHIGLWVTIAIELQASTTWTRSAMVAEEQVKTFRLNPALLDGDESRLVSAIHKLERFATRDIIKLIDEAKATYVSMEKKMQSGVVLEDEDGGDDDNLDELFDRLFNNEENHAEAMDIDEWDGEVTVDRDDNASTSSFAPTDPTSDTEDGRPLGNMMYGHDWLVQEGLLVQQGEDVTTLEYMLRCKEAWEALKITVAACQKEIERLKEPVIIDDDDETIDDVDDDGDIVFVDAIAMTAKIAAPPVTVRGGVW